MDRSPRGRGICDPAQAAQELSHRGEGHGPAVGEALGIEEGEPSATAAPRELDAETALAHARLPDDADDGSPTGE